MIKKLLFIFVGLFVLLFVFNSVLMPLYVKQSKTVEVPDVMGMNFRDAKQKIEEAGLEVKQGENRYDPTKPIGEILEQSPPGGLHVKIGRRIYLYACGGEQLVDVPKLIGRSLRDARFTLEQRGIEVGEVVKKFSNEYPDEVVISQIVQPGSKVKKSSKIDLIISNGPELGDLRVPGLEGKTVDEARKIIIDSKLKVGKITYQPSTEMSPGKVLDQYPKKDKSANENTRVDLFIAKKLVIDEEFLEPDSTAIPGTNTDNDKDNDNKPKPDDSGQDSDGKENGKDNKNGSDKKIIPKPVNPDEEGKVRDKKGQD